MKQMFNLSRRTFTFWRISTFFLILIIFNTPFSNLKAQNQSYDPFIDYNEFDTSTDEDADINFFRNGRFLSVSINGGYRIVTGNMQKVYDHGIVYGINLNYFLNLQFAIQFNYFTGTHNVSIPYGNNRYTGSTSINQLGGGFKYFINTQNVTRGLALINPYMFLGISQTNREGKLEHTSLYSKEGAPSFDAGIGIEVPLGKNRMFIGAQALYHLVNFKDENREIYVEGTRKTGIIPRGDFISLLGTLGVSF